MATYCGQGYLTYNGKRIGAGTVQDFEFVPNPDVDYRSMIKACGREITATFHWEYKDGDVPESVYGWPVVIEQFMFTAAELEWGRWRAFERDLDRRLRWLI